MDFYFFWLCVLFQPLLSFPLLSVGMDFIFYFIIFFSGCVTLLKTYCTFPLLSVGMDFYISGCDIFEAISCAHPCMLFVCGVMWDSTLYSLVYYTDVLYLWLHLVMGIFFTLWYTNLFHNLIVMLSWVKGLHLVINDSLLSCSCYFSDSYIY